MRIVFGAMAPPIIDQLREQGAHVLPPYADRWQRFSDAITLLSVQGLLPEKAVHEARKRLVRRIKSECGG